MVTVSYSVVTSEEKNSLKSYKTLIEEGEQLYQLHEKKSELEEKCQEKVGQLKGKQIHFEQLRDHNNRLKFAYEKKARYTYKKSSPVKSVTNAPRLIPMKVRFESDDSETEGTLVTACVKSEKLYISHPK